jgi:TetR/AcrR family tetracycline transcriptional repressor
MIAAESFPFPLMARGLRERAGSTVEDDFRYALGVLLAGLEASVPRRLA